VAALGLAVVTQPHFIAERGDDYVRDVAPEDQPWLYRARAWLDAGVPLAAGSDAPYGSPDPWRAMEAAVRRTTAGGAVIGAGEALSPEQALALFTGDDPAGAPRRVAPGARADLCLLDRPWREARAKLASADVAATWCGGRLAWRRDPP
jgi:predicted amidohydrolase YtcJ